MVLVCASSFAPLGQLLVEEFRRGEPEVSVRLEIANDRIAWQRLRDGQADLALLANAPEPLPLGWRKQAVALEGLAVVVHRSRRLGEAGLAQIQAIFSGSLVTWGGLGDEDGEIQPVSRESGSAARALFEGVVMGGKKVTSVALVTPTSAAVVEYVRGHPDAIGYVAAHWVEGGVKMLSLEGSAPTRDGIQSRRYPLILVGNLVFAERPSPEVRAFAEFAASPAGRAVIARAGYVLP